MNTIRDFGLHRLFDGFDISPKVYSLVNKIEDAIVTVKDTVSVWIQRHNDRKALLNLSQDHSMLRDIGLTYCQVQNEIDKPFWKK